MQADNLFALDEPLYLRIDPAYFPREYADINEVPLNEVRFPDFSVNRGKYSIPEDVLRPNWPKCGIATFQVQDVPQSLPHPSGSLIYNFRVEHVPELNNYSHSDSKFPNLDWCLKTNSVNQYLQRPIPSIG